MSISDDLRSIFSRGSSITERALDVAEEFVDLREEARAKGLDWGQIKALLKARGLDKRDDGERVQKLIDKADLATAYADMLGLCKMNENKKTRSSSPRHDDTTVTVSVGGKSSGEMPLGTFTKLADAAKTPAGRAVVNAAIAAAKNDDKLPAESMTAGKGARPAGEASTHEPASTDTPAGLVSSPESHGNSDGMDIPAFLARGGETVGGKIAT